MNAFTSTRPLAAIPALNARTSGHTIGDGILALIRTVESTLDATSGGAECAGWDACLSALQNAWDEADAVERARADVARMYSSVG